MKTIRRFLLTILTLASGLAAAEWTAQDEQACNQRNQHFFHSSFSYDGVIFYEVGEIPA